MRKGSYSCGLCPVVPDCLSGLVTSPNGFASLCMDRYCLHHSVNSSPSLTALHSCSFLELLPQIHTLLPLHPSCSLFTPSFPSCLLLPYIVSLTSSPLPPLLPSLLFITGLLLSTLSFLPPLSYLSPPINLLPSISFPPRLLQSNDSLPTSQTCFFQLRLPNYVSQEVLCERLRYAIRNCRSIDMDNYMLRRSGSDLYDSDEDDEDYEDD